LARSLGAWGADLNLGCPQLRAKEGGYGSYLADEPDHCVALVKAAHDAAGLDGKFAITVKIRLQPTLEATLAYASRLREAGAVMICVHGRQRGTVDARRDGSADLSLESGVAAVVEALKPFPVLSNGNVRCPQDVVDNILSTKAAGVAVAEEILRNPGLFDEVNSLLMGRVWEFEKPHKPRRLKMLAEYLDVIRELDETQEVPSEDGSGWRVGLVLGGWYKGRNMVRADSLEGFGKTRYSNWWPHAEVLKQHARRIVDTPECGFRELCQRSTYRKTRLMVDIDTFLRKRMRLPGLEKTKEKE